MLSLPESWELPLCKDLKLFLETQQHQEILTHCPATGSGQRGDPPGLGWLLFSRGQNKDCNDNHNPGALQGLHIQLWIPPSPTSASGWEPDAHRSCSLRSRGSRGTAKATAGCDTHEQQHDGLRTEAGAQGALCHLRSPDTTTDSIMLCRMMKHPWCSHLETICAWMWGRGRWFQLSQDEVLHPVQLTITVKAPRSFPESLPQVTRLQRPQLNMSKLQWAQLTHSEIPLEMAHASAASCTDVTDGAAGRAWTLLDTNRQLSQFVLTLLQHPCVNFTNNQCFHPVSEQATLCKEPFQEGKKQTEVTTKTKVKWGIVSSSDSHSVVFHAGSEELGFHQCSTIQHGTENIFSANESSLSQQTPGTEHWGTKIRRRKLEKSKNLYHSLQNRFTSEELSTYITHQ